MKTCFRGMAALTLLASALALGRAAEETADEKLLKEAGVGVGGEEVTEFFRKQSQSAPEVEALIRRLGDNDIDEREKASRLLRERGSAAIPSLKAALKNSDAEVVRRAQACLEDLRRGPWPHVPPAAARLLAQKSAPGAVPVLLDYLPFTGDPVVENEVFAALLGLTPEAGKADAALAAALRDPSALKRAAAAYVLGRKGDKEQTAVVRKLLSDKDPNVRRRAALALLAGGDKEAPPALIALLDDGPADLGWQAEDVLLRLAGDKAPPPVSGDAADARRKRRDLWAAWWMDNADKIDLARFDDFDHPLGYTLGVEYNTGRVWECTADGAIRWELRDLGGPMDAQVLPNGRVLIAEWSSRTVRERDLKGDVKWEKKLDVGPTGCRRLPNGNTFVTGYGRAMEFAPDGSEVFSIKVPSGAGAHAIHKHPNGHILYATGGEIGEYNAAGKPVRWFQVTLPPADSYFVDIQDLPGDRFLLADSQNGMVQEVDAKGKVVWEAKVPGVCGVERTPGGGTLVTTNHKVVELNRDGQVVWEKATEGYARRVHRR